MAIKILDKSEPMHKSVSLMILTEMGTFGTTGQR